MKAITFNKTELQFLNMVLNEVSSMPNLVRGRGYEIFAFYMMRKLEGRPIYDKSLIIKHEEYVRKIVKMRLTNIFKTKAKK